MDLYERKPNSPWMSLLILVGLTLGISVVIQFFVIIGNVLLTGDMESLIQSGNGILGQQDNPTFLYILLASSSIGTFLLPAIFLQQIERYHTYFSTDNMSRIPQYVLGTLALIAFAPAMQIIGEWNMRMELPGSMNEMENWMRTQEDNMAELTKNVVMVQSIPLLLLNILVMAVLPAIAEEYYFRGSLQHIFQRFFHNHHLTVWVTGIIFSAIHVQFFGFFPRLILGVFFGYMYVWSRNIWVPILGHFINNASVAVLAFVYARQGKTYADLQAYESYPIIVYLGSFVLTAVIGWYFYKKTHQIKEIDGERLDKNQVIH